MVGGRWERKRERESERERWPPSPPPPTHATTSLSISTGAPWHISRHWGWQRATHCSESIRLLQPPQSTLSCRLVMFPDAMCEAGLVRNHVPHAARTYIWSRDSTHHAVWMQGKLVPLSTGKQDECKFESNAMAESEWEHFLYELLRAATRCSVYKMSENSEKMSSSVSKGPRRHCQMSCLSTTHRYSVYCHRGKKKPENLQEAARNNYEYPLIDYQSSWGLI